MFCLMKKLNGQEEVSGFVFILSSLLRDSMQILFFHLAQSQEIACFATLWDTSSLGLLPILWGDCYY